MMLLYVKRVLKPIKIRIVMLIAVFIRSINKKLRADYSCSANTQRCFNNILSPHYKYEYFGDNTPACCATHLYHTIIDVTTVLTKHNIKYFISFGTLLGAIRHGGLIPWDTDTDIIIAESDKNRAIEVLKQELDGYWVLEDRDEKSVGSLIRVNVSKINTLHIDLFTYIENEDGIVFGYNRYFAKSDIFPLKQIDFYTTKLYAPNNLKKQLETFYGKDYMHYAYKQWAVNKTKFKITDFKPADIFEA
jgi:hypothetical protein